MSIPSGYTTRPLEQGDATAVFELMAAQERHDIGEAVIEEADIVGDWARPSHDLGASSLGVFVGGHLVGYGEVVGHERGDAAVHPDHRGRGLGTAIATWMQDKARERGYSVIGMPVPADSPGDRLLEGLGYHVRWNSWVLQLPEGATIPDRELPEGYAVRTAEESEYAACWTVQEDAFLEWADRDREPFEDWQAEIVGRPGFAPWQLRCVTDASGSVVAMANVQLGPAGGFIARLATDKNERGRGLAQCLLVDSFREAVAHGAKSCELSTDSRTGALSLYEKVGMVVTSNWVNRAIAL
ncbi:GNAT superfamily N-acetyltransferase [Nocardioides ginsengisegetis]|uniref:GNAT superfamily N-acetyltransferase n=1 Tax=Nocardioides ginsengisegetis TaxID=661491 RepID=A0A7W3J3Q0_9ACTN|nr:GNAT family N-acetyltransferase [Nocardioides ginsengisegetis]MBA8805741.1 GNAT superfamily N-acetyltransferase [Nocardioides ginsengisegetis]